MNRSQRIEQDRPREQAGERHDERQPRGQGTPLPPPALLAAGNRAFTRAVRAGTRTLARYDTGEHAQMGSDRLVTINGVQMTEAEMAAMGDLYETPAAMYVADPAELREVVKDIRADVNYYLKRPGGVDVKDSKWEEDTQITNKKRGLPMKKAYLKLAEENTTHFGPASLPGSTGKDHKSEWERWHREALDLAHGTKASSDPRFQQARIFNGFASHFLTDAFASGHLISKDDTLKLLDAQWQRHDLMSQTVKGILFNQTTFTDGVARIVMTNKDARKKLDDYRLKLIAWRDIDEERFSEFLYQFASREPALFFGNFVKVIHDRLNRTYVEVTNQRGDPPWQLSGDGRLADQPKTLPIARAAVEESYLNLDAAQNTPGTLDYDALFKNVWSYTPIPTPSGLKHIRDVLSILSDPDNLQAQKEYAEIITSHIDDIIKGLVDRGVLQTKAKLHKEAQEMMVPSL